MSASAPDFYQQKTDAELLFFVEHPDFYQPDLIAAARQELRRRGVAPAPLPLAAMPPETEAPAGWRLGPLVLAVVVALLAVGLGVRYFVQQKNRPAATGPSAPGRKAPPQLTEVATSVIPNYDGLVAQTVKAQLQRVPAAERASAAATLAGQSLRQYRELGKRFWTAETQTEYLTAQARAGKAGPLFAEQTLLVRATWQEWNNAAVYGYKFGPAMRKHVGRMRDIASSQQHVLEMLPGLLTDGQVTPTREFTARSADIQSWLAGLLPASPVTGQAYEAPVLTIRM